MVALENPFRTIRLSAKLMRREGYHYVPTYAHWCPGCEELHDYAVDQPFRNGARWSFSGPPDRPSFSPSMNISIGEPVEERCHYYLTVGVLQFCPDSTHALAGQSVPLPDIPQHIWLRAGINLSSETST
jgi:hypothetical protein